MEQLQRGLWKRNENQSQVKILSYLLQSEFIFFFKPDNFFLFLGSFLPLCFLS